ncbi:MAG: pilus assembly protein PilM [Patescibacteria group bacterium]|jgi:type IV pilus assembly protein PilM
MSLFGTKKEEPSSGLLGVDIGTTSLKIVELMQEGGKIRLVTYGYADIAPGGDVSVLSVDDPKHLADIIQNIVKTSGMNARKAVAALPASSVFHAIISIPMPKSAKEDIRSIVEVQTAKLLPLPISEMIIDSHIIDKDMLPKEEQKQQDGKVDIAEPKAEVGSKTVRVQVTAAPKALVEKYIAVFKMAKLDLVSLETEVFALMRALIGKDSAKTMIVDVGGERTNIIIAERGVPYVTRGIKSGGNAVTSAFSSAMGIGMSEAEAMKKDIVLNDGDVMPSALVSAIKPLLHEAKYALDMNLQEDSHVATKLINKVILTGGSAQLAGFDKAMTNALDVNVYVGDPWARIATPLASRPVLDEVGSRFAVAIGLAMRVVPEKEK